tara:strand:- start:614 stop:1327 length:714 start_codon:yes stop_codon:yes gene_type:complete
MNKSEITYRVPESLYDIKIKDYQRYLKLVNEHKEDEDMTLLNLKSIEIFCNIPLEDLQQMPMTTVDSLLKKLSDCFDEDTPLIRTFKMVGTDGVEVEFGFEPELHKIALGAYWDAEKYFHDNEMLHRFMAVVYRPILTGYKDKYVIDEYKGSELLQEVMLDAPVSIVLGAQVFFWNLGIRLSKHTMDSLAEEAIQKMASDNVLHLEENGELINQYLHSHKMMSEELKRLQNFHYTTV